MASIQKRRNRKGEHSYTATIRKKGAATMCRTFSRRTDAETWVKQEELKIEQGLSLDVSESRRRTLQEVINRYLFEEKVLQIRRCQLQRWSNALGAIYLSAISEVQVNETVNLWRCSGVQGKVLSNSTINRHLNALSVVFEAARSWGWTKVNPVRLAKKYREPPGRVRYLTDDEREHLLAACRKSSYRPLELIVLLVLSTGMRKEEILNLRWKDVDPKSGTILLLKTKNAEMRRVYVRGSALNALRQYSVVRSINSDFLFGGERPSPRKLCRAHPISERHFDIRKPWERALEKAGVENFRFHDLRHSAASYLAMSGATLLEIAEILGHKTLAVTKRYAHLSDSYVSKIVERMNETFLGTVCAKTQST